MRILYLTDPSYFDAEISLIRELSKLCKIKVILIVTPKSIQTSAFSVNNTSEFCGIISSNSFPGMKPYEKHIDFSVWDIANNPTNSFIDYLRLSKQIKDYIIDFNPDIIHSTTQCLTSVFLLPLIKRRSGTLFTMHDPIPHDKINFFQTIIRYRLPIFCYKNLLFLSTALVEQFVTRYNYDKKKIYFSRLGVYDYLRNYPVTHNIYGCYILFFGRIENYKGVDLLIDAYNNSQCKERKIKLLIAGKGHLPKTIQSEDIIFINNHISNIELANIIRHCKFVVLPYKSATQSGCLMSAFALNKPVLGTNVGDFILEIENGKTGLIVNSNSIDNLVDGINTMCNMDKMEMEKNIQKKYSNGTSSSWRTIAQNLLDIYKNIVK